MMANYPYFGFPNYLNYMNNGVRPASPPPPNFAHKPPRRDNFKTMHYAQTPNQNMHGKTPNMKQSLNSHKENSNTNFNTKPENKHLNSDGEPIINIFGISLYFDDILIICLIFFLYNEKVTDYYLFFVLILLLLS